MIRILDFMIPTPKKLDRVSVRACFLKMGFDGDAVEVWGDHNKVFIKKVGYLSKKEWKLFCSLINRLGARYRKDYGLYVIRIGGSS